ncbi:Gata transcription factor [Thalictrum thalictroides]|uniref:GATA transcription factor n=1 Tax=Thalictrum thalictroides TaxID=46969 RepID=A0A7J6VIJ2_THATH|nr:Gata transcription factor [Thalictrum thalictroides]
MESQDLCYSAGNTQFTPEKQQKTDENFVEELFDFSNEDVIGDAATFDSINGNSTDSSTVTVVDSCNSSFSGCDPHFSADFGYQQQHNFPDSQLSGDLCVPCDDIAELEWLSNIVEESFSSEDLAKLQLISGMKTEIISETRESQTETNRNNNHPIFQSEVSVPGKARSKRSRVAPCNWSSRLLVISPTTTITTTTTTTAASSSESDISSNSGKKTTKVYKKKENSEHGDGRRCLHCATDKTPQWRTGPLGPKTLCNACGVRYKSGRLVPEYRPASSPTFVLAKHSNSHRKVMELRRQKEMQSCQQEQFLYPNALFDVSGGVDDYLIHHQTGSDFAQLI